MTTSSSSSLSHYSDDVVAAAAAVATRDAASRIMTERAEGMTRRARDGSPLTGSEIRDAINSLRNVTPAKAVAVVAAAAEEDDDDDDDDDANANANANSNANDHIIDWDALGSLLSEVAHASHRDWDVTARNSERLAGILTGSAGGSLTTTPACRQMFERVLHEGNWDGALAHAHAAAAADDDSAAVGENGGSAPRGGAEAGGGDDDETTTTEEEEEEALGGVGHRRERHTQDDVRPSAVVRGRASRGAGASVVVVAVVVVVVDGRPR
jgi:hypothetical protein